MSNLLEEIVRAEHRIRGHIRETPLEWSLLLTQKTGCDVYLKLENLQHTGSFKVRGAMNKMLSLSDEEKAAGVVTASTGNHGAAVAYCLSRLNVKGKVFVPEGASAAKVKAIRMFGAEVCFHGEDCVLAEIHARECARREGMVYVSPYNDPQVVGGQGTLGVELARQLGDCDAVFASLGGGGMIAGLAEYLKSVRPGIRIIGCSPENSPVMVRSIEAGRILEMESRPTLSDGTAGGVEQDAITFDLCRRLVDEYVLVSEEEIRETLLEFIESHHMLVEGAAAVAVAAVLRKGREFADRKVAAVVCGGNISLRTLKELL